MNTSIRTNLKAFRPLKSICRGKFTHYDHKTNIMKFTLITIVIILNITVTSMAQTDSTFKKMNVAIFIYDGVEILDFSGPAEVFAVSGFKDEKGAYQRAFNVYTVAVSKDIINSQGFLKVVPDYSIFNCPKTDIIVLPGGSSRKSRENIDVINWIKENSKQKSIFLSVCTGAFLLGEAGLLNGKKVTTWYGALDRLKEAYPEAEVLKETRFVDNGKLITTAGVSAGIDGALHLVGKLLGLEAALGTAEYMEYDKWDQNAGLLVDKY